MKDETQKITKGWRSSHGLMCYLDENANLVRAVYFDDKAGKTIQLFPCTLRTGYGYVDDFDLCKNTGTHNYRLYFRKDYIVKHKLIDILYQYWYNPDTQKLERIR